MSSESTHNKQQVGIKSISTEERGRGGEVLTAINMCSNFGGFRLSRTLGKVIGKCLLSIYVTLAWTRPFTTEISVAVITFSPFLLCRYFYYQLVAYCVCFKMIREMSL